MRSLLLLLISTICSFGQIQVIAPASSGSATPALSANIQNITITVQPNQYLGTNVAITANTNGATVTSWKWRILHRYFHTSGPVDTLVHQTSTSQNPTFSIDSTGFYDIQLIARNGIDKYVNYQTRYFVVLQARFTEAQADLVIDMSAGTNVKYYDFSSAPVPDYKIYIKNSNAGTAGLEFRSLRGTAGHPVRIQKSNDNIQVQFGLPSGYGTGKQWFFSQYGAGEGAQHVIIDGFNLDGTPGIKVITGTVSNISIRVEGKLTDIAFYGVEIQGLPLTVDGAAIAIVPTVNSTCNFDNWSANNIHIWHCVGTGSEEFAYVGESSQAPDYVGNNGFVPPNGIGLVLSRNRVDAAGRDGLQAASISGEAEDNYVSNVGLQSDGGGQESCFVNNPGAGIQWRRNYCINTKVLVNILSGLKPWSPGAGQSTPQKIVFEDNIMINGTFPTTTADEPYGIFLQNNPSSGAGDWTVEFKNNVIVSNKKCAQFTLALGGFTSKNFVFANNIIIKTGTAGDYAEFDYTGNGDPSLISGIVMNNQVLNNSDDKSGYYFNNPTSGDFSITSLLSAAYSGSPTILSVSVDYYGYPLPVPVTGYFFGAQGNYNKRIIAP